MRCVSCCHRERHICWNLAECEWASTALVAPLEAHFLRGDLSVLAATPPTKITKRLFGLPLEREARQRSEAFLLMNGGTAEEPGMPQIRQVRRVSPRCYGIICFDYLLDVFRTSAPLRSGLIPGWPRPRRARGTTVSHDHPTGSLREGEG